MVEMQTLRLRMAGHRMVPLQRPGVSALRRENKISFRACIRQASQHPDGCWLASGCRKNSKDFSDSLKNTVTFPPFNGRKVLAALAERLAKQGIQGI